MSGRLLLHTTYSSGRAPHSCLAILYASSILPPSSARVPHSGPAAPPAIPALSPPQLCLCTSLLHALLFQFCPPPTMPKSTPCYCLNITSLEQPAKPFPQSLPAILTAPCTGLAIGLWGGFGRWFHGATPKLTDSFYIKWGDWKAPQVTLGLLLQSHSLVAWAGLRAQVLPCKTGFQGPIFQLHWRIGAH